MKDKAVPQIPRKADPKAKLYTPSALEQQAAAPTSEKVQRGRRAGNSGKQGKGPEARMKAKTNAAAHPEQMAYLEDSQASHSKVIRNALDVLMHLGPDAAKTLFEYDFNEVLIDWTLGKFKRFVIASTINGSPVRCTFLATRFHPSKEEANDWNSEDYLDLGYVKPLEQNGWLKATMYLKDQRNTEHAPFGLEIYVRAITRSQGENVEVLRQFCFSTQLPTPSDQIFQASDFPADLATLYKFTA